MRTLTVADQPFLATRRSYKEAVLADSTPAGMWLLNDPTLSGTNRWQDSSGNNRHASDLSDSLNPTPTTSTLNGGLSPVAAFDGSDDRILISSSALSATSLSFEAFIKVPSAASFWTIAARCATSFTNTGSQWYARVTTTQVQFARFSGGNLTTYSLNATVMDDAWHHIVWTYDSSTYQAYVDGVSIGSTATWGVINTANIDLCLGCDVSSAPTNFKAGSIAGAAIHPGVILTGAQAAAHHAAGR